MRLRDPLVVRSCLLVMLTSLMTATSGCALLHRGNKQTVTVVTNPRGQVVNFQGRAVADGERLTVHKGLDAPKIDVGSEYPVEIHMTYDPDPWLLGDAGLLFFFVVPGVIALGVDFRAVLDETVSQCKVFLAVIGSEWLTIKDQDGQRRLDDPADFVRTDPALIRPAEVDTLLADPTKAREQLGWTAKVSFRELVEMMVEADLVAQERAHDRKRGAPGTR